MNPNTQVTTQRDAKKLVQASLMDNTKLLERITIALEGNKAITPARMLSVAMTACMKDNRLLQIMQTDVGRASVYGSLIEAAQIGVEVDGRQAHLIVYGDQAKLLIGYAGMIDLACASGDIISITPEVVFEHDEFREIKGSERRLVHVACDPSVDPGALIAAYTTCELKSGRILWGGLLYQRHIDIRMAASRSASKPGSIWKTHTEAMWKKSSIRAFFKYLPRHRQPPALMRAIEHDDLVEVETVEREPEAPKSNRPKFQAEPGDDVPFDATPAEPPQTAAPAPPVSEPETVAQAAATAAAPVAEAPRRGRPPKTAPQPEQPATPAPAPPAPAAAPAAEHPSTERLRAMVLKSGVTETELAAWAIEQGHIEEGGSIWQLGWKQHNLFCSAWENISGFIIGIRPA